MNKQLTFALLMVLGFSAKAQSPSSNQNYVVETTVKVSGKITAASLVGLPVGQANRTIQYFDGLGRPLQTVNWQGSPNGKDLVQIYEYDAFGREAKKYLPYAEKTSADGSYKPSGFTNQSDYYKLVPIGWDDKAVKTDYPFSITKFEPSPLNRMERQGFPGVIWQPGSTATEHTKRLSYSTNNSLTDYANNGFAVRKYKVINGSLSSTDFYEANQLYLTISKDENWQASDGKKGTVEEYKNKEGRVVLKRQFNENAGNIEVLSTYYVYDDYSNLSFVLPPGVNPDAGVPNATALEEFCYQYKYDRLKRLVEKRLPGKGWEYTVYNKLDQVVLTQDSLQRNEGQWLFTKYDNNGRNIMTGVYHNTAKRLPMQIAVNGHTVFWEERNNANSNGEGTGYSSLAFPNTGIVNYHTINYYDDYDFYNNEFGKPNGTTQVGSLRTLGKPTGSRTNTLGTSAMLLSTTYYDDYERPIQIRSRHHLNNGYDVIDTEFDFDGSVKNMLRTHVNGTATTTIATAYTYDHMGRKKTTSQRINGATTATVLSDLAYNEIGQLMTKKLANGLQSTAYTYNERGWLTTSNGSPQFSMELKYNQGTHPQFNGNISSQSYTNNGSDVFTYRYDNLNRLISGVSSSMSEVLDYDLMGNIKSLNRDSAGAKAYNYTGNQLKSVSGLTGTYVYDGNGNAITDVRNGVTLTYNHLSLPITAGKSGLSMAYTYDATGAKLRKVSTQGTTTVTDYVGGIQYNNNVIDFIQTEEGIARNSGGTYIYEYNLTDHLGNVRVTFKQNPNPPYGIEVLQRDNYYAFGMRKSSLNDIGVVSLQNKHLYNGKELQQELEQYDYGARFYDPVIGRWNVIDPMAEKFFNLTPYNYTDNNPVNNIDPDGMTTYYGSGNAAETWWAQNKAAIIASFDVDDEGPDGPGKKKNKKKDGRNQGTSLTEKQLGKIATSKKNDGWAHAALAFMTADLSVPDPTDSAWPKWAAYGIAGTAAVVYIANNNGNEEGEDFYYVTYTKINAEGKIYVGRTSGYGDPYEAVAKRDASHHMKGYGPAVLSTAAKATVRGGYTVRAIDPSYWLTRASEQVQIEYYRSKGVSGNAINGISPNNPKLWQYLKEFWTYKF